jgi:hypothetical protein
MYRRRNWMRGGQEEGLEWEVMERMAGRKMWGKKGGTRDRRVEGQEKERKKG